MLAMAASYSIDSKHRLVHSIGTGILTDADVLAHNERLKRDALFQPMFRNFWDLTDVDQLRLTSAILWTLSQECAFAPTARRAFVVSSDVAYGLMRMFTLMSGQESQGNLAVFRDREEAWRWLEEAEPLAQMRPHSLR
jgi:hypothetical protein